MSDKNYSEVVSWNNCKNNDLWIFNKLFVASRCGYVCGPSGVPVPTVGEYFVKPVMNIEGMGKFARKEYLENYTDHLHPGEFWCEIFKGEHLSIDYEKGQPILSVIGTPDKKHPYQRFIKWEKIKYSIPFPQILLDENIHLKYPIINCEFIGGNLIEVHLRGNPDFSYGNTEMIPVWKDQEWLVVPDGFEFVPDHEEVDRIGILIK
jgi:hypothetical protein